VRIAAKVADCARDPLAWALAALLFLALDMQALRPLFAAAFPALDRPLYEQEGFGALLLEHLGIVAAAGLAATGAGLAAGIAVTRAAGREFLPMVETVVSIGQTVPPVAVLAIAIPLIGFGQEPAILALALYGVLPVLRATIAGIDSVPAGMREAADGLGMRALQRLWFLELPLALPVILAGIRTSVVISIGTAAIASTAGARTLGSPILLGLSGFNTAYVIQGALMVGLLAVVADMAFERAGRQFDQRR